MGRDLGAAERLKARFLHFLRPYFLMHYAGFVAWFVVRDMLVSGNWGHRTMEEEQWLDELTGDDLSGVSREMQIFVCWAVICFARSLKAKDVSEIVGNMLFFGEACVFVAGFIADWYIPFYFVAYWCLLFVVMGEPSFEVPNRKFWKLDKVGLNALYEEHDPRSDKANVYWFVNVWASWQKAGASKQFSTTFADMSATYHNHYCRFSKVDAGRAQFQDFIKNLGIDTSATSKQIPSLILFKNGKELRRLPLDKGGSYLSEYTREQIARHFDLDKIEQETTKLAGAAKDRLRESKKSK